MKSKFLSILSISVISTLLLNGCGQSEEEKTIKEMEKKQEKLMEINPIFGMMMKKEIEQKKEQLNETPIQKEERLKKGKCKEYQEKVSDLGKSIFNNYEYYSDVKRNKDITYFSKSNIENIKDRFEYSCEILPKYINTTIENKCISNDLVNEVEKITYLDLFNKNNKFYLSICEEYKDIKIEEVYNNQLKLKTEKK